MSSHSNYGHFSSSAPSSYPRQAPQPYASHGQSHAAPQRPQPSFRQPTRKKSNPPTSYLAGSPQLEGVSYYRHATAPIEVGSIVWISFPAEYLVSTLRMDSMRAGEISRRRFLVLVDSVGLHNKNEIGFLFLYHRAPAAAGDSGLPRALHPHPRHSVVLTGNITTSHSRTCITHGLLERDMHIWTAPPMTAWSTEVYPGNGSTVSVGDRALSTIRQHAEADLHEQNAVWTKAAYNDGFLHSVTSDYSQKVHVKVWTNAHEYILQSASDPAIVLGLLYNGSR